MHIKSLIVGFLLGAAAGVGAWVFFGESIRGDVAEATEELGEGVQQVGKDLERTGGRIR